MKVTREDQQSLIELLALDRELGKLRYALSTLPAHDELDSAESDLAKQTKDAILRSAGTIALDEAMAQFSADADRLTAAIARKQGQLDSGENMDSRQLLILQGDIDGLKESRDEIELAELDAMQEMETLEAQIAADEDETARLTRIRDDVAARRADEIDKLEEQIADVLGRREALAASIAPMAVKAYDASRSVGGAGVVIMAADGSIDGGIDLSVTEIEAIRALPDGEVYLTEDTGSIVVTV